MSSLLELQDKYNEALIGELIEKTKRNGILWTALDSITYQAQFVQSAGKCPGTSGNLNTPPVSPVNWAFTVKKTPVGNLSGTVTLEVLKNGEQQVFIRDEAKVSDLFEVVELLVLQLDEKLKQSLQFVQDIPTGTFGQYDIT